MKVIKKIIINNEKDYHRFIKKLIFYKSLRYKHTFFELVDNQNNKEELYDIIEILNIKNRKQRIIHIYDKACALIDEKVKGKNICGFKNSKCYIQRKAQDNKCNGCCRKCIYQNEKGCPTKNLACKMFNCSEVTKRYDVTKYDDLKLLKLLSLKNQFIIKIDYFSKREDVLKDLYTYTLFYAALRIFCRIIKMILYNTTKNTNK